MQEKIRTAIRVASENGTRKVRITYKVGAVHGVFTLMALLNDGQIIMSPGERTIVLAVALSGNWGIQQNRTYTILMTPKFREDAFVTVMSTFLEKVEYARPKQAA